MTMQLVARFRHSLIGRPQTAMSIAKRHQLFARVECDRYSSVIAENWPSSANAQ